jgi:hypothetical protein
MGAPIEEIANTVISKSFQWIFDTSSSPYITPGSNHFKSFLSVLGNIVLNKITQVEYTGVSLVCLSCHLIDKYISVIRLYGVFFLPNLRNSLYN